MGRPKKQRKPLPPIWRASDDLWAAIEPILADHDPPKRGPQRIDQRAALDAIIFRLRTGCQWNWLPKEYPDDSSVHRTFQRWVGLGIFDRIWAVVQEAYEEFGGCDWQWQAADTSMGKARLGGTASDPTRPTAKPGVKRSLLVEADGGPLAVVLTGANIPDAQLLAATIEAVVLERPPIGDDWPQQHLCFAALEPAGALWDFVPLKVIVEEAGGRFTDFGGASTVGGGSGLSSKMEVRFTPTS